MCLVNQTVRSSSGPPSCGGFMFRCCPVDSCGSHTEPSSSHIQTVSCGQQQDHAAAKGCSWPLGCGGKQASKSCWGWYRCLSLARHHHMAEQEGPWDAIRGPPAWAFWGTSQKYRWEDWLCDRQGREDWQLPNNLKVQVSNMCSKFCYGITHSWCWSPFAKPRKGWGYLKASPMASAMLMKCLAFP